MKQQSKMEGSYVRGAWDMSRMDDESNETVIERSAMSGKGERMKC